MNILIIDDNEMTRSLLRAILTQAGHAIVGEASTCREGIRQASQLRPDLICLDIVIPDGSGLSALRQLGTALPHAAVLMITGVKDAETAKACIANGAKGVITKPFKASTVLDALNKAMEVGAPRRFQSAGPTDTRKRKSLLPKPSDFTIRARLWFGFGIFMLITLVIALTGIWALHASQSRTEQTINQTFTKERLISDWQRATRLNAERTITNAYTSDEPTQRELARKIDETSKRISDIQQRLEAFPKNELETAAYGEVAKRRDEYIAARNDVTAKKQLWTDDGMKKYVRDRLEPALGGYLNAIEQLANLQKQEISTSTADLAGDGGTFVQKVTFGRILVHWLGQHRS